MGGTDEGPPGIRPHYGVGYYAAFVRDPDGYKLEAVFREPKTSCGAQDNAVVIKAALESLA